MSESAAKLSPRMSFVFILFSLLSEVIGQGENNIRIFFFLAKNTNTKVVLFSTVVGVGIGMSSF